MGITVTRARVKEKCGIADSGMDAAIDALILEIVPVVEARIRPEHLADVDAGTVATLALAATEVVAGEVLAQLDRAAGRGKLRLFGWEFAFGGPDPSGMIAQGWGRLAPYLGAGGPSATTVAARPTPEAFE
jgi:hypothetical protein